MNIIFTEELIKIIDINEIKSQENFEKELIDYYDKDNNQKILLIKFNEEESYHLNFIIRFIKNFETNELPENSEKKIIISTIHLKRKFINDEEEIEPISKRFISHMSDYNQFFIDNLNTKLPKFDINKYLKENENEQIIKLLNIENNLEEILTETYLTFNFEKSDDNSDDNYVGLVVKKIVSNENAKNFIVEKIKKFVSERKNILHNYLKTNKVKKMILIF